MSDTGSWASPRNTWRNGLPSGPPGPPDRGQAIGRYRYSGSCMTGLPVQVYPRSLWPRLDPDRLGPLGVMNGCVNRDVCGGFLGRFRELRRLERLVGYEVARLPPWVTCSSTGSVPPCILCPTAFSDTPRASDASFTVANPSGASSLRLPMGPPSVAGRPTLTAEAPRCPTRTPGRPQANME